MSEPFNPRLSFRRSHGQPGRGRRERGRGHSRWVQGLIVAWHRLVTDRSNCTARKRSSNPKLTIDERISLVKTTLSDGNGVKVLSLDEAQAFVDAVYEVSLYTI